MAFVKKRYIYMPRIFVLTIYYNIIIITLHRNTSTFNLLKKGKLFRRILKINYLVYIFLHLSACQTLYDLI